MNRVVAPHFVTFPIAGDALSRRRTQAIGPAGPSSYFPPPRCDMTEEKEKLLAAAISQIEKDHGKGAIMRLGSRDILVPVSVMPSAASIERHPLGITLTGTRIS